MPSRASKAPCAGMLVLGIAASSCQAILGFEDFSPAGANSEARDGGPEVGGGDTGGGAGGVDPQGAGGAGGSSGDARAATGGGSASENVGVACTEAKDCSQELECVFGFCRSPCSDDSDCRQGSDCLVADAAGGCQLDGETCSADVDCRNADLVCGIDGTCRVDCSTRSCEASTQRCIASTCVSTLGERAQDWDCGGVDDGTVTCDGTHLQVCNVVSPGLADIETCNSAGLCLLSIPENETYDEEDPPACQVGCEPDALYCDGATLLQCKDDGSGPVDSGETCATPALCAAAADAEQSACPTPACTEGESRCGGDLAEVVVQTCNADRTGFADSAFCEGGTPQCNPTGAACFALDVDPIEVSIDAYRAWLDTGPNPAEQPGGCSWNTTFVPDAACEAALASGCGDGTCPRVCVDWCDAYAYCEARGRRLCGRITGGMNPYDRYADAGSSQWMNACSAGGQYAWGAGAAPDPGPQECTYSGTQLRRAYSVGTRALCHSPSPGYEAFYDLSGNVEEWEDSCEVDVNAASAAQGDACRTRGGSFDSARTATRCDAVPASAYRRRDVSASVGFRCCARPPN